MGHSGAGEGHGDHVLLGGFDALADGLGHFGGLAGAEAYTALLVTHHHQGGKLHHAAALDGLGYAVQGNELLHELAGFSLKSSHCRFLLP